MSSDRSRKRTPGENVAKRQEPAKTAESQSKDLVTEGEVPITSKRGRGRPRKRPRIESENLSPPRNKPHGSKKDTFVSQTRKAAPPRVRKTYRNRQKIERSSLGHCVNPDVDYDEIPPSTVAPNSPTAKGRTLAPKKSSNDIPTSRPLQMKSPNGKTILQPLPSAGPWRADEIPDDKKQDMRKPNQSDALLVQVPPTEAVTDDDDPIQSFSSSPSKLLSLAADAVKVFDNLYRLGSHVQLVQPKPEVSLPCDAGVRSDCLFSTGSPVKSFEETSTVETIPVRTVSSYTILRRLIVMP